MHSIYRFEESVEFKCNVRNGLILNTNEDVRRLFQKVSDTSYISFICGCSITWNRKSSKALFLP
jgi:hypothetical protein